MTERVIIGAGFAAIAGGFALAAWILRYELRHQMRERRYGGYVRIGGQQ